MSKLVLLRHGKSLWNKLNLFTGWVDVPLSLEGVKEALTASDKLKAFCFDRIYTSLLIRSIQTAMLVMSKNQCGKTPIIQHKSGKMKEWANIENKDVHILSVYTCEELNERYYGKLQGFNKTQTAKIFGENKVHQYRRSYTTKPPGGESLEETAKRTLPFFKETIINALNVNKNILISAHGNSLRSILMFIDNLSGDEIAKTEIATGTPIIYTYENGVFKDKKIL